MLENSQRLRSRGMKRGLREEIQAKRNSLKSQLFGSNFDAETGERRKKEHKKETANYRCFRQDSKDFQILALVFMFAVNTECRCTVH